MYKIYTNYLCGPGGRTQKLLLTMKLTFLLIMVALMQVSAASFGQKVTLKREKVTISRLFWEIRKQTGYDVLVESDRLNTSRKISVSFLDAPLTQVLEQIVQHNGLRYEIGEKIITIRPMGSQQPTIKAAKIENIDISGKVVDEYSRPLSGASVKVKGSDRQTLTDENGKFTLVGIDEKATIVISYLGYTAVELPASTSLGSVQMKVLDAQLDEVKVTYSTGYQKLSPERTTGSFTRIDNELFNRSVSTNVLDRLNGVASGVLFNTATSDIGFSIRGRSTILANTNPLIVVDNFPYDGDLSTLNPNDVEDVTILKDAGAASIWGVRAANGVVVVTTKKGKYNKRPEWSFNSSVNIGEKPALYSAPELGPSELIDISTYMFERGYYDNAIANGYSGLSPLVELLLEKRTDPTRTPAVDAQIGILRGQNTKDDLLRYYYRTPVNQQYSLSAGGGDSFHKYYFSAGYDRNLENVYGNKNDRLTITTNNTLKILNDKLFLDIGLNFTSGGGERTRFNLGDLNGLPYLRLSSDDGSPVALDRYRSSYLRSVVTEGKLLDWSYVPLNEIGAIGSTAKSNSFLLNPSLTYRVFSGLELSLNYQYLKGRTEDQRIDGLDSYFARDLVNRFSQVSGSSVTRKVPLGGVKQTLDNSYSSESARFLANYSKSWNKNSLVALAGAEFSDYNSANRYGVNYGYDALTGSVSPVDNVTLFPMVYNSSVFETIPGPRNETGATNRKISYFGNLSYTYDERYTVSASLRKDESNLFGVNSNQKGVPLGSVGLAYMLSREKFYHISWLPRLKLRANIGYNGNVDQSVSAYLTLVRPNGVNAFNNRYSNISFPPNSELRWEKVRMLNIGVDFGLFGERLSGSFEYYAKKGIDIIGDGPISSTTGVSSFRGNSANISGRGFDLTLQSKNLVGGFQWNTIYLLSHSTDRIDKYLRLANPLDFREGYPFNALFSYRFAGLDPTNGDPQGYLNGVVSKQWGAINSVDDVAQYTYSGSAIPTFFGSLRNDFSYQRFSLSVNVVYKLGYYFRRTSVDYGSLIGKNLTSHTDYRSRWQKPGDELITTVPSLTYPTTATRDIFYRNSDVLVEKGDHIRLQDVRLGYRVENAALKKIGIRNMNIYGYANNLGVVWTANKRDIDPDSQNITMPSTYAIGLQLGF